MDRKTIIVLAICVLLFMLWGPLVNRLFPPTPLPPGSTAAAMTNQVAPATNLPSPQGIATNAQAEVIPDPALLPQNALPLVRAGTPEQVLTLENSDVRLTLTSHGGGIKNVELKEYPAAVSCDRASAASPRVTLNAGAALPVLAILGGAELQGDGVFKLSQTANGARAEKTLSNGLSIVKELQLGSNHLFNVTVRLENHSDQPITLPGQEWVLGTATGQGAHDDPTRLGISWYDGEDKQDIDRTWFSPKTLGCFPGAPRFVYIGGASNVVWADVHSQFFTLATMPRESFPHVRVVQTNTILRSGQSVATASSTKGQDLTNGIQASLLYPGLTLGAKQSLTRQFQIYAGPKEYLKLSRLGKQLKNNLDAIMGYGGPFGWFAQVLLASMNGLNSFGLTYGLAIIAITVIIKLLFWPLTNASTRSMKRMAALQPQMKALQEKYKEDPAKMNRKLMEFMKEHKVSPLGGCLPMLLQIPVFIGFYQMIQSAIELRGARFLWCCDLSKPDTVFTIPGLGFVPFIGTPEGLPVNPLPLLMGVTMLWQARLTPPSPGMDPVQQKIMKYMPLMFLVILYNFSAGLTLYWTVQNLLTIAQMKLTKTKEEPTTATTSGKPAAIPTSKPAPSQAPKKKR